MRSWSSAAMGVVGSCLAAFPAWGGGPELVWTAEGFDNPESVYHDVARDVLYVSNVNGPATEKNGEGYIARLSLDGEVVDARWVTGLDAPKGLVMHGDTLYVTDIDRLVAIDVATGAITDSWPGEGAKFLNDLAVDDAGRVYVSDMVTNTIHRLDGDRLEIWLQDDALTNPNGLRVEGDRLLVAAWGAMAPDFSTKVPGHLEAVDLETKVITSVGDGTAMGNLDGLEPDGRGGWLTTDWISGGLIRIGADGRFEQLLDLDPGSADLEFVEGESLAIIPMMQDGVVVAYRLD